MGSGNSRLGPRPARPQTDGRPRLGLASFLCGGASSSCPPKMEEEQSKKMMPARIQTSFLAENLQASVKDSPENFSSKKSSSNSKNEHHGSSLSSNGGLKECLTGLRIAETSGSGKCFSESKELVPSLENASSGLDMTCSERACDLASTSSKSEHLEPLLTHAEAIPPMMESDGSTSNSGLGTSLARIPSTMSQLDPRDLSAGGTQHTQAPLNELLDIHESGSNSAAAVSSSAPDENLLGEERLLEPPSAAAFVTSNWSEVRNGSILHVDVVSISSNSLPSASGTGEISNSEARRNSRRLFWDAFSRRSSRRNYESSAILSSVEDTDDLGSQDRWLLDINDDIFGSRFDYDSVYLRRQGHGSNGRRWHSRSEIRERLRGGLDGDNGHNTFCPTGLHPDGTCSCDSLLMAEESSTRASISRIVMLAEALFEVLDEIHRQPLSLSLSMVTRPAPESVVDSLPLKNHTKHEADDIEQCYICLAEYEDGDKIRVLPCRHEYHMSCVDKWLKEIHGVCPLCRGEVGEGAPAAEAHFTSNL